MLLLSGADIQKIFTMQDAIQAAKEALRLYSEQKSIVPLRVNIPVANKDANTLFMPAHVMDLNATGIKIVGIFPTNAARGLPVIQAQNALTRQRNVGAVCAMMDGTYLTQLRTGATQGAATDLLARPDAKIAVLFGTGGQAPSQLEAMLSVRELAEIRVCSRNYTRATTFAKAMKAAFPHTKTQILAVSDGNLAIEDADIITAATTSSTPIFDGSRIKPGVHVNGVGSYTHTMQELPASVLQRAHKILFDTREGVLKEAGDILIPLQQGKVWESDFTGELGELLLGEIKGRESPQEITVFKSVGSAVLDVVTAFRIYQKALVQEIGKNIAM